MSQYLENHKDVKVDHLVSSEFYNTQFSVFMDIQLLGIANGLQHLHSIEVVHGDLKGVSKGQTEFL